MTKTRRPIWFILLAIVLALWGVAGCLSLYVHIEFGRRGMPGASAFDQQLYRSLPGWFDFVYGVAVGGGLAGAIALLLRSRAALALFVASLVAVIVQFGWVFLTTDLIAVKGAPATVPGPVLIAVIALFQIWLARLALRRGWIG